VNAGGETTTATLTAGALARSFALLLVISAAVAAVCSLVGHYRLDVQWSWAVWDWSLWRSPIWQARAFRLLAAAAVGTALGTGGLALQALLRNPLAEPYVLGISSGAGLGVLLGTLLASVVMLPEWATTPALALIGAMLTSAVVYGIAQRRGRLDPYVLLLSGVIINVFNGALILAVLQFVKQTDIVYFVGWGMGQIPEWLWFKPKLLILCWALVLGGWAVLFARGSAFNTLGLGDEVASSAGVAVAWVRVETFVIVSLMTSSAVALAGPVGFVGLIIPHVCRMLLGPDHRHLAIVCGFAGAMFLMLADTLCRVAGELFGVGELPVGVITAMIGGPFFIIVLRRRLG